MFKVEFKEVPVSNNPPRWQAKIIRAEDGKLLYSYEMSSVPAPTVIRLTRDLQQTKNTDSKHGTKPAMDDFLSSVYPRCNALAKGNQIQAKDFEHFKKMFLKYIVGGWMRDRYQYHGMIELPCNHIQEILTESTLWRMGQLIEANRKKDEEQIKASGNLDGEQIFSEMLAQWRKRLLLSQWEKDKLYLMTQHEVANYVSKAQSEVLKISEKYKPSTAAVVKVVQRLGLRSERKPGPKPRPK